MASEPTRTLIEDLENAAHCVAVHADDNPPRQQQYMEGLASRLREAAGRLAKELESRAWLLDMAIKDGDEMGRHTNLAVKAALERINGGGGPLVTSGADPGPKGEAQSGVCDCCGHEGIFAYVAGPPINGGLCATCHVSARSLHPAASPATGMEPGRRCTLAAGHRVDFPHEYYADVERSWATDHTRVLPRCPYIEPTPTPEKAKCPGCGGRACGKDVTGGPSFAHTKDCPESPRPTPEKK